MAATITSTLGQLGNVRVILALAAVFGVLTAQTGRGTLAFFTDVATSSGNTFTTGTIDLSLAGGAGSTDCAAATFSTDDVGALLTAAAQKPGDIGTAAICIKNVSSTLTTRWDLSSSVTDTATGGALKSAMKVAIWAKNVNTAACDTVWNAAGSYSAPSAATELYGSNGTTTLASNPVIATAAATELTTSSIQKVCFSVVLPSGTADSDPAAGGTIQGKQVQADFTITGNQV